MGHLSETELQRIINHAQEQVLVGRLYAHYKHPKNLYRVLSIAINAADDVPCVLYQAQYGNEMRNITFARPVASWLEDVEVDGRKVKRFTLQYRMTNLSST